MGPAWTREGGGGGGGCASKGCAHPGLCGQLANLWQTTPAPAGFGIRLNKKPPNITFKKKVWQLACTNGF